MKHKPQQRLSFERPEAIKILLEAIAPFMVSKRPQAELLLRAIEHRISVANTAGIGDDATLQDFAYLMGWINKRGPALKEN